MDVLFKLPVLFLPGEASAESCVCDTVAKTGSVLFRITSEIMRVQCFLFYLFTTDLPCMVSSGFVT